MEKSVILLAKSYKHHNYCVAGIDRMTGEWIRFVSDNATIQHAISQEDMACENGTIPDVMDIVNVRCLSYSPSEHQSENYLIDPKYYWNKVGTATAAEVLAVHPPERFPALFYNTGKTVTDEEIQALPMTKRRSLSLIQPSNVFINIKLWPGNSNKKLTANFDYEGTTYKYINITDPVILAKGQNVAEGCHPVNRKVVFIVSLGDTFIQDNNHYKLIASIIDL